MSAVPDRLHLLRQGQREDAVGGAVRPSWRGRKLPSASALSRRRFFVTCVKRLSAAGSAAVAQRGHSLARDQPP